MLSLIVHSNNQIRHLSCELLSVVSLEVAVHQPSCDSYLDTGHFVAALEKKTIYTHIPLPKFFLLFLLSSYRPLPHCMNIEHTAHPPFTFLLDGLMLDILPLFLLFLLLLTPRGSPLSSLRCVVELGHTQAQLGIFGTEPPLGDSTFFFTELSASCWDLGKNCQRYFPF